MDEDLFIRFLWGFWLVLPMLGLSDWLAWDRLPLKGRASVLTGLYAVAGILGVITLVGYVIRTTHPHRMRPLLFVVAFVMTFELAVQTWLAWGFGRVG